MNRAALVTLLWALHVPLPLCVGVPAALTGWCMRQPEWSPPAVRLIGLLAGALGAVVLIESFVRFVRSGGGSAAPRIAALRPTGRLVVTGFYQYVRNPMYLAVLAIVFGQGLLFASPATLVYDIVLAAALHAWVCWYEEPRLRSEFGMEYDAYCRAVRRWTPTRPAADRRNH